MSNGKVYIKVYRVNNETIVAACDEEVLGMKLEDPSRSIKFYVDPLYFKGELKTLEELIEMLTNASSANLVGKRTVEAAVNAGLIHKDAILLVNNIPIAFFVRV